MRTLERLSWTEVAELRSRTDVAIIPIGQVAQHGVHLPLGTDGFQVLEVAQRVVQRLEALGQTALISPLIPFGLSPTHREFPGCLNLRPETLTQLLVDIGSNLLRDGFTRIVLLNGNGGNWAAVDSAAFHLSELAGVRVFVLGYIETVAVFRKEILDSDRLADGGFDGHAGELETSCVLAIEPELVRMDKARAHVPAVVTEVNRLPFAGLNWNSRRRAAGFSSTRAISEEGHWGHPELASVEKGNQLLDRCAETLTQHLLKYVFEPVERNQHVREGEQT